MEIFQSIMKGHISLVLNEEEVARVIELSGHQPAPEEKPAVVEEDPLKGMHKNNREFIKEVYEAYGEGPSIHIDDNTFMDSRRRHFVVNVRSPLNTLNRRGVITYGDDNNSFTFIKSPLAKEQ